MGGLRTWDGSCTVLLKCFEVCSRDATCLPVLRASFGEINIEKPPALASQFCLHISSSRANANSLNTFTMDSSSTLPVSSDPKIQFMNEVKQAAAINNARQLIEVCSLPSPFK